MLALHKDKASSENSVLMKMLMCIYMSIVYIYIMLFVESQNGIIIIQWCSVENQKGAIAA